MQFLTNPDYRYLVAIVIFILAIVAQNIFLRLAGFIITKFFSKNKTSFTKDLIAALHRPLSFLFIFFGAWIALLYWGGVTPEIKAFIGPAMKNLIVFIIFWSLFNLVTPLTKVFLKLTQKFGKELGEDIEGFVNTTFKTLIILIGFISIMHAWGYNVSGFLASLGLVGMALALAAKETASNLFGSLVIFTDRPFKVGDWIMVPEVDGIVEEIGIRSTKVRTFAQAVITVPNAIIANSAILNWTKMGKRRIKMNIGLTYSTTSEQMSNIISELREMLKNHKDVHQDVFYVYFTEYSSSSLDIFCYFFTKSTAWGEHMRVREDVNFKIMKIVEKNGASFAFPSNSIYIEKSTNIANLLN